MFSRDRRTALGGVMFAVAVVLTFGVGIFVAGVANDRDTNAGRITKVEQAVANRDLTIDRLVLADEANRAAAARQGVELPAAPARDIAEADAPGTVVAAVPAVPGQLGPPGRRGSPGPPPPCAATPLRCIGLPGGDGAPGENGTPGKDGGTGKNGLDGTAGGNGLDGLAGTNGTNGTDGATVTGPAGPAGPAGAPGPAGSAGERGPTGPTGPAPAGIVVPDGSGGTCTATPNSDGVYACPTTTTTTTTAFVPAT